MADAGIKKTIITNDALPVINTELEGYLIRYRIISEDKNRLSSWSETKLIKPEFSISSGSINHTKSGSINLIAWDPVSILKGTNFIRKAHEYDIWLRWGRETGTPLTMTGDWIYAERIDGTSISVLTPLTYTIDGIVQPQQPNRLVARILLKGTPINKDATFLKAYENTSPWTV